MMMNPGGNARSHGRRGEKLKKNYLPKDEDQSLEKSGDGDVGSDKWGYEMFDLRFPEIAKQETRSIIVREKNHFGLPKGTYSFHEMFCRERDCDCRRVFFYVASSHHNEPEAIVCYGWESRSFYKNWFKNADEGDLAQMQGPVLNWGSPRTENSEAILEIAKNILLPDRAYIERIKRHYEMFKADVNKRH